MKPHHYAIAAALLGLTLYAVAQGRAVFASFPGFEFSISASGPPIIEGTHTETANGWLVEGPATITVPTTHGALREMYVPRGETRRVKVRDGVEGLVVEVGE